MNLAFPALLATTVSYRRGLRGSVSVATNTVVGRVPGSTANPISLTALVTIVPSWLYFAPFQTRTRPSFVAA
jgi:hypothetical protein